MLTKIILKKARLRLLQMHYESGVGHIGGNLSCIDVLMLLHYEFINKGDKFILSKGHSAGALYIALWSLGLLNESDLRTFHKDDTLLPGHPPVSSIDAILFAAGSLGHGLSLSAGTALALKLKKEAGHVFCLTSDGEWQEGSTWEALIFASHHKLKNLTILVDHNCLQGFGSINSVASMAPLEDKIRGFDLEITRVDGHDLVMMRKELARPSEKLRIIILETIKGKNVSFMENKMEWHYLPMNKFDYEIAVKDLHSS